MLVTQHLPFLELDKGLDRDLRAWFRAHVDFMQNSEQGKQCLASKEDKPLWYHAIVSSPHHTVECYPDWPNGHRTDPSLART